jgi:hypothetical protein
MGDTQPPLVPLAEGAEFELLASEDGTSFKLCFKSDRLTAHLQGEDAARFLADYHAIKLRFPTWNPDQTLAQLWDQGGYSWLAAQEGV